MDWSEARSEWTSLSVVASCVVFSDESNGELLGSSCRRSFFRSEIGPDGETTNVRQVLLQLIFSLAFHLWFPYPGAPSYFYFRMLIALKALLIVAFVLLVLGILRRLF
jgi:hypothetical protein